MHALVAAAGGASGRFDGFQTGAAASGARLVEWTGRESRVRLGAVTGGGAVLDWARGGGQTVALLGSGLLASEGSPAARMLKAHRRRPPAFLDGAPEHLAGLVADIEAETLTIGSTSGNHRLFVAEVDGGVLAATQIGFLAAALGEDLRVDRAYEDFLLGFGFLPDDRTLYEGVRVHPGGTVLVWPGTSSRPVERTRLDRADPPTDPAEARRVLHDTFFGALEEQAGTRRRHAVLLGGFDSALVVAGLRRLGHEVDTYTFGFGDPRYEQRNAEQVSTGLGARHTWVRFTPRIIGEGLERFSDQFNQPGPQPHYQLHTSHACRIAREEGHGHVFTGDGCDAAFLGYPMVSQRASLVGGLSALPRPIRRAIRSIASARPLERRLGHVARTTRSTLDAADLPHPARGHLPTRYLDDVALARLRTGRPPPQRESVEEVRMRLAEGLDDQPPVRLAFDGKRRTGESRTKVEGAVAVSGAAQMSPFQHPNLRSFARALPVDLLRPPGRPAGAPGKALLLDMVREYDLLPEAVVTMPKQSPVDSPIDQWYAGPLRPLVYRMLDELPFEYDRGYIDEILARKYAEEVFRRRISIGHHAFQAIGLLCSYAAFTGRAR